MLAARGGGCQGSDRNHLHPAVMTPQQELVQPLNLSNVTHKLQIALKLLLLENARTKVEEELRFLSNKAYEEVQGFFNSSFSASLFSDLSKALDVKCQAIDKLSALLKDLTLRSQLCVQPTGNKGVTTIQLQPTRHKGILITDVLKFRPILRNTLMGSSIAKAVQVVGATLSLQQLRYFLISQPTVVQEVETVCSVSSSYNSAVVTTSLSCQLKSEEKERKVVFEEKRQPDAVIVPPAIIPSPNIGLNRHPLLLPPIKAVCSETHNPKAMKITPQICWGREDDVQVQHQKQTSSQLLHFLRTKAKNMGSLGVTVMECSEGCMYTSSSPQSVSPTIQPHSYRFRNVADHVIDSMAPKALLADDEKQAPVFRVKRAQSSGSLTYTCVIVTKTELWDMGDIITEVVKTGTDENPLETNDCPNRHGQVEKETTNVNTQYEKNSAAAKLPENNPITIPKFEIRKFEETEVVVSHIVSPDNFYIQHADSILKLQALDTNSLKASSSYAKQNCIPDIGTRVMGWFPKQEQWCRAEVTKICGVSRDNKGIDGVESDTSIKVELKRLDYGDTASLSLWNIMELTPDIAVLPLQTVQVSLANVIPVNGKDWSEEAVGWFRAMVHNRTFYARLYTQGSNVTVELFLEKGKLGAMRRGASLSLRLAQNGHAKHSKLKNFGFMKRSSDSDCGKHLLSHYTGHKI